MTRPGSIRSMTGFGAASAAEDGLDVRVEVRSVNHRHLQVKSRLPGDASHLESEIEGLVRRALERGSVTVTVALRRDARGSVAGVDLEVARGYQRMLDDLAKNLGLNELVRLETILELPGVVVPREDGGAGEHEQALIERCVGEALRALIAMRSAEGKSLETDLTKNTHAIARIVAKIEKRMPQAVKAHQRALTKRLNELLGGSRSPRGAQLARAAVSPADLARELAVLADRMDMSEELTRLKSHLDQWKELLGRGQAVGRQLDFLVQELLREANTIGAKCNDAVTAHDVVELKTLIERLREQVQNVE
jgi:uncharacterized protein (TIGR00255 family)